MSTALWSERKLRRTALVLRLHQKGPARVYAELRWIQLNSGRKAGWVAHCFREIFGTWPRPRVLPEPSCPLDHTAEEWIATRKRPNKRRRP
jgi:hypothetical protein